MIHELLLAAPDTTPQVLGLGLGAVLLLAAALCLVLWLATLVSVLGSTYSGGMKLLLVIACFAFPVLGPLAWFVIVKGNQPALVHRR